MKKQTVLPMLDKIKVKLNTENEMMGLCIWLALHGFPINESKWGISNFNSQPGHFWVNFTTEVYSGSFERYESYRRYHEPHGVPLELSLEDFMETVVHTTAGRRCTFNWVNLYAHYIHPNIYPLIGY